MKLGRWTSAAVLALALLGTLFGASLGAQAWDYARVKWQQMRGCVEGALVSEDDRVQMLEVQLNDARAERDEVAGQLGDLDARHNELSRQTASYAAVLERQRVAIEGLALPESRLQLGERTFTRNELEMERDTVERRRISLLEQAHAVAEQRLALRSQWEEQDRAILDLETRLQELQPKLSQQRDQRTGQATNCGLARAAATTRSLERLAARPSGDLELPSELAASNAILAELKRQPPARK